MPGSCGSSLPAGRPPIGRATSAGAAVILSSDGAHAALLLVTLPKNLVDAGSDAVTVYSLESEVVPLAIPARGWKSRTLPAWRNAKELYYAALPRPGAARPEIYRWSGEGSAQPVSAAWPDLAVSGLLAKP